MSYSAPVRRFIKGVIPGGGFQVLVAHIVETTAPPTISYYTMPVVEWVTMVHSQPGADDFFTCEPFVLAPDMDHAEELWIAIPGIGETAAYRILSPEDTELSRADREGLERELIADYRGYRRPVGKTQHEESEETVLSI